MKDNGKKIMTGVTGHVKSNLYGWNKWCQKQFGTNDRNCGARTIKQLYLNEVDSAIDRHVEYLELIGWQTSGLLKSKDHMIRLTKGTAQLEQSTKKKQGRQQWRSYLVIYLSPKQNQQRVSREK